MYIKKSLAFFLTSVLVILLSLSGSQEIMAQNAGLILHLPFDEGSGDEVKDESPTGLDGTVNGDVEWTNGIKGKALSFDGESTYVNLPVSDVLSGTVDNVTFSLWFNVRVVPESGPPEWAELDCLLGRAHNGDFTMFLSYGALYAMFDTGGWLYLPANPEALGADSAEVPIETGRWYHAVATYEDPVGKLYLDGELVTEGEGPGGPITYQGDDWTQIGGFRGSMQFIDGVIDEVKIYDRALSLEEIKKFSPVTLQDKLSVTWGEIKERRR